MHIVDDPEEDCFNPCFSGRYSAINLLGVANVNSNMVSILVLVEGILQ